MGSQSSDRDHLSVGHSRLASTAHIVLPVGFSLLRHTRQARNQADNLGDHHFVSPHVSVSLSLSLTGRHRTARLAALLSILATSPATLVTPTPEPFFSFFALLGHLCLQHTPRNTFSTILFTASAALCFAVATAFRANGILLAGFIAWHIVWRAKPFAFPLFRLITAVLLSLVAAAPLLLTQLWAFERFCGKDSFPIRSWCDNRVPSVYSFVQSNYWWVDLFAHSRLACDIDGSQPPYPGT